MKGRRAGTSMLIWGIIFTFSYSLQAQKRISDNPPQPLVIQLNDEGSQYIRFMMWHQIWLTSQDLSSDSRLALHPSIRRSRFLAYAKISPRVLILTHWGLNGLTTSNMTSLGNEDDGPQLFLHGAWGELELNDHLFVGGGLHYWNGLTRLSSQSTISFMTLDQSRPFTSWHSLGITDQFGRHLGFYLKGDIGRLNYRLAINSPLQHNLGEGKDYGMKDSGLCYDGAWHPDNNGNPAGKTIITGYFKMSLLDPESSILPYQTGTYLGKKKVLALGAGFFYHPSGMYSEAFARHQDVSHMAIDGYLEWPVDDDAIHIYVSAISFNYGKNYVARWAGTGNALYGELGYYFHSLRMMPYLAYNEGIYEGLEKPVQSLDVGINYFLKGHNAKLTLEYHRIQGDIREPEISTQDDAFSQMRLQLQVFM